jgi:protein O-mannosyl-transferase
MAKSKDKRQAQAAHPVTRWYWAIAAAIGLILAFIVYSPAAQGPFVLDDRYQFFGRPEAARVGFGSWIAGVRPLLNATFWINYQLSGTGTESYHHLNVVLHVLTSLILLMLLRMLWRRATGQTGWTWPPVAAAVVFLLHPLQTESVAYVSSRSESLSVMLACLALALQLRSPQTALSLPRIAGVLACFGLAVLTKEHAAAMPAVFLLTDYFWRGGWPGIRANWKLHASMAAAGALGLAFVARILGAATSAGFGLKDLSPATYLFTQLRMYWRYLRMLVWPVGLNADPDIAVSQSLSDPAVLAGLAGIITVLAAAWILRHKAPLASYGIAVFTVLLAPTSSFVPILDVFAEHRVYLPFLGFCCLILEALRRWRIPPAAVALVLGILAIATFQRNSVWASETALWTDAVAGSPLKYRPRFQLAYAQYTEGNCPEASREFEAAAHLVAPNSKPDVTLYVDWALALECAARFPDALAKLDQAARLENSAHIRALMGMVHAKNRNSDQALVALDAAEKLDPNFAMTYVYRGNVFASQNRRADAEAQYHRALALDPANAAAAQALALLNR